MLGVLTRIFCHFDLKKNKGEKNPPEGAWLSFGHQREMAGLQHGLSAQLPLGRNLLALCREQGWVYRDLQAR